ncbi:hypothetical protein AAF712_015242 [Marasmius tenuissimus]|uniref:Uncharacterized protein n=1 Tax=Marasmius tenuissimus TaxID=585030 RepID=A0ABR2Z8U0_9AGAR
MVGTYAIPQTTSNLTIFQSRFLDIKAELSSEHKDKSNKGDKEPLAEDDDDFIDNMIQVDSHLALPHLLQTSNGTAPDSWMSTFSGSQTASRVAEDEALEDKNSAQHQVAQILQRNSSNFSILSSS